MQHLVDGRAWKDFDTKYLDFAAEPRNVRLGLTADGFNPFSNLSKGTRKPNLGDRRAGRMHTRQETQNLMLKAITDKNGPVPIKFKFGDRDNLMPLDDHAVHWSNYLKELVRELPLHYPSWHQMPSERKAGVVAKIGTSLTWVPNEYDRGRQIYERHQQHQQKIYNGKKVALKERGKQRGHIPGVGMVLLGHGTVIPPPSPCTHSFNVAKLKKREKRLTNQPEYGGGNESGGCGDDEPGDDEDGDEDREDEDDSLDKSPGNVSPSSFSVRLIPGDMSPRKSIPDDNRPGINEFFSEDSGLDEAIRLRSTRIASVAFSLGVKLLGGKGTENSMWVAGERGKDAYPPGGDSKPQCTEPDKMHTLVDGRSMEGTLPNKLSQSVQHVAVILDNIQICIVAKPGVETIDVATGLKFNMRAMVLWTINDFPVETINETQNLRLKAITDKNGPVPIKFRFGDRDNLMPLDDHAVHWSNYLKELVKELPLHYPSWHQMPSERKAGVVAKIRTQFDLGPHMEFDRWPQIYEGIQQHLQKIYNGKKVALKERYWVPDEDGTYDVERIRRRRPSHISEMESSATREYPSLIHAFFLTHTVNGVFLNPEDKALYEERLELTRTGQSSPSASMPRTPRFIKLKKRREVLTRQVNMFMKLYRSDDKFFQMLTQLKSQPEIGGGSRSGGRGDDEQGDDEDDGEDGEDEDDS
ncbi:reverse transcriptase domain-containing protein [Tanacetum coccineum]